MLRFIINIRDTLPILELAKLDGEYIKRFNLWFDIWVIIKTVLTAFTGKDKKMKSLLDTPSGRVYYTVCKIINHTFNGETKTGTGFLLNFTLENGKIIRSIITCKHNIKEYQKLEIKFCADDGSGKPNDLKEFIISYQFDFNDNLIIRHPCEDVDVCALVFSYADKIFVKNGQPFYLSLDETVFPTDDQMDELDFIQNILMVGYPEKVYDIYNHKPIVRRGVTATPIHLNFSNKPEFLIDCASFHGSSGSPVFVFDCGSYATNNSVVIGSRFYLLGIFIKGWEEYTDQFKKVSAIIDEKEIEARVKLPNNIGVVLKLEKIIELKTQLEEFALNTLESLPK